MFRRNPWSYDGGTLLCCCYGAWLLVGTAAILRLQSCGCSRSQVVFRIKPLELRRWYLIMLLLQSMAPSGYSRSPQAPKLWMQQISTCVPAKPLELRCARCSMLLLQCLAAGLYNTKPLTSKLRNSSCVPANPFELRCARCSMLLLQCLAAGLYNTKPLTSTLRNSSSLHAALPVLRRWYLIMLLLQSLAPSGYSRNLQAPKLWMQQMS